MASHRLYAAWQDENRSWHTIGRLTQRGGLYEFVFTKGASVLGTMPKDLLGMNIYHSYRSPQLFSLFRNKLPSRTRPDFRQMAGWLGLSGDESEIALLEKFGLIPGSTRRSSIRSQILVLENTLSSSSSTASVTPAKTLCDGAKSRAAARVYCRCLIYKIPLMHRRSQSDRKTSPRS